MNKPNYFRWILLAEGVGGLSGFLSRQGMKYFTAYVRKPPLTPPPIVFPVVWGILFALMGISAARVAAYAQGEDKNRGLNLYVIQLVFNFFWSLIFFNLRTYGLALLWLAVLWGLVFAMIRKFRKVDGPAWKLQIPYLLWLSFAFYLNYGVWILN